MTNEELQTFISNLDSTAEFEEGPQYLNATIEASGLRKLAEELKNNDQTSFDYLFCLTGVDWPEFMTVVYHLKSTQHNHAVVIKAKTKDRENPNVDTVSDLWQTAEFHEREAYDFYGIIFNNHPDLRRIFLEDDREGWPMRKDFEDPINIIDY